MTSNCDNISYLSIFCEYAMAITVVAWEGGEEDDYPAEAVRAWDWIYSYI